MRHHGIRAKTVKQWRPTTSSHHQFSVTANTLNRQFMIDRPNRVWAGDISYIWTVKVNRDRGTRDERHWQSQ